jgi:4-amino-4-deoxy-L-arabinose transferase-like glycosyltransferase
MAAILAFAAVAGLYNITAFQSFSSEEAMDMAQLARNISDGHGFTTHSIRPVAVYLLGGKTEALPDVTVPPAYPFLLAALMKVTPMQFTASQYWLYQPERWIAVFNQALFFVAIVLLFHIARRLFDSRVAWVSAVLFGGTSLFWKFSVSGLATIWVIVVFLAMVACLVRIAERPENPPLVWSALAGALAGIGALSRYSFAWMILPVILFLILNAGGRGPRGKQTAACVLCFAVVLGPWVARNIVLTGTPFGTASYAVIEGTPPLPGETLERSLDPRGAIRRAGPFDVINKFIDNGREIWLNDFPRLGGNWVSAFFLVGLFIPFQSQTRSRMRLFLVGSMVLLFIVQALGRTHVAEEQPELNSENMLVLLAPMVFVYGIALFFTLIDQMSGITAGVRSGLIGVFLIGMSAPLIMSIMLGNIFEANSPYRPTHIQKVARLMQPNELVMSDIPSAMGWYGDRDSVWLSLDDDREFLKINNLRNVKALYLTQRTTDERFLSAMIADRKEWGHFYFECVSHGEVPTGFPLNKAPTGFLPDQLLLSDNPRWMTPVGAQK